LLREQANLNELRRRADAGDRSAAEQLAGLLREQGNLDEATAVLRPRAGAAEGHADRLLAGLLREQGNLNQLRRRADGDDRFAAEQLAGLLREQGNLDEAIAVLRPRADADEGYAARQLARLLHEQGNLDERPRCCAATPTPATAPPLSIWQRCFRSGANLDERIAVPDIGYRRESEPHLLFDRSMMAVRVGQAP
jgi:tetratricopeptide (TPR) repeat protein